MDRMRRALVVDDHPSFRRSARRMLEAAGWEVVGEAGDAADARGMAAECGPTSSCSTSSCPTATASTSPAT